MKRAFVTVALAAACARSGSDKPPPSAASAVPGQPDAGPSVSDGGMASTPPPDGGSAPQAELMDPDAVGIVAISPDGKIALVNHRLDPRNVWNNDLWQVSRGQAPRRITVSGNGWAYFSKDGSVFEYNAEDGLTHVARTADGAVLAGVTIAGTVLWYPDGEPGEWLGYASIKN